MSEVAHFLMVIQIQIQAVWHVSLEYKVSPNTVQKDSNDPPSKI